VRTFRRMAFKLSMRSFSQAPITSYPRGQTDLSVPGGEGQSVAQSRFVIGEPIHSNSLDAVAVRAFADELDGLVLASEVRDPLVEISESRSIGRGWRSVFVAKL
jgi:hypothetical protein